MSYKCLAFAGQEDFLSNIVHLSNVGSMLGQRRRRWPSIKTPLDQCLVWVVSCNQFSGYINTVNLYSIGYCWPTLDRPRHARFEAEWFFKNPETGIHTFTSAAHLGLSPPCIVEHSRPPWMTIVATWLWLNRRGRHPASTRRWSNADLMLGQRRRRWTSIKSSLDQCLVFAG